MNTSTSPKVQYGYAGGGDNTIRPTTLTYPDGRVLNYNYGSSGSTDDALGRIAALIDNDGNTHLADYSYLGQNRFIEVDYPEPDLRYTLVGTAGGNDPDTGDIYLGLDRFGRIKDSVWYDYGSSVDADRVKYGYDRMGSRTFREQTVDSNSNHDEFYQYDQIDRLKQMDRGTLSAQKDSISTLDFAQCWTLDPTGNWQGFKEDSDGDSTWDLEQTRTSNAVNEITNITETTGPAWLTPVYNRAGNMTTIPKPSDPTTGYTATYDGWNRLVKLEDGEDTVAEYRYDGAKRRIVQKTYTGGSLSETRHFLYTEPKKWQVIEERVDASTYPDRQFIWGKRYVDDLALRDRDTSDPKNGSLDERLYAQQDANWNVTSLADTSGSIVERFAYGSYGTPAFRTAAFGSRGSSSYAWETLFAGYRFDNSIRAYHVRHRVYHSVVGCWTRRDPSMYDAQDMNLYRYAGGEPASTTDPSGRDTTGGNAMVCSFRGNPPYSDDENRLFSLCGGMDQCPGCSAAACKAYMKNVIARKRLTDFSSLGLLGWLEEHGLGFYGGKCHLWACEFVKINDPPKNSCIRGPITSIIPLDPESGWETHHIVRFKNTCTGRCLVLDDGFWGDLGPVYDPCNVSPPLLSEDGAEMWENIVSNCGCD